MTLFSELVTIRGSISCEHFLWGVLGRKGPSKIQTFKKTYWADKPKSPKNQKSPKSARAHGHIWALAHMGPWALAHRPLAHGPGPMGPGPWGGLLITWALARGEFINYMGSYLFSLGGLQLTSLGSTGGAGIRN